MAIDPEIRISVAAAALLEELGGARLERVRKAARFDDASSRELDDAIGPSSADLTVDQQESRYATSQWFGLLNAFGFLRENRMASGRYPAAVHEDILAIAADRELINFLRNRRFFHADRLILQYESNVAGISSFDDAVVITPAKCRLIGEITRVVVAHLCEDELWQFSEVLDGSAGRRLTLSNLDDRARESFDKLDWGDPEDRETFKLLTGTVRWLELGSEIEPLLATKDRVFGARLKGSVAGLLAPWYGEFDSSRAADMRSLLETFVRKKVITDVAVEVIVDFASEMYAAASAQVVT
jgi:hypothetical protein